MRQAATDAWTFVDGLSRAEFIADKRTQQAVVMSLIIVGEAAAKVLSEHAEFAGEHSDIAWTSMRGMRNRMAHAYYEVDLAVIWDTVQTAIPVLLTQLRSIQQ
jgi:uncharacterized protein with HEPN domain